MMVAAEKQADTKAPPPEAQKAGADAKAGQTLHGHVQEIQAGGNVKPNAADVAKGSAQAEHHFGKVVIVDHGKPGEHPAAGKPDAKGDGAKPEAPPKPEPAAAKPEAPPASKPEEAGVWGWMKSTASSAVSGAEHMGSSLATGAEHLGAKAENLGSQALTGAEHLGAAAMKKGSDVVKAVGDDYQKAEHAVSAVVHSDTVHNLEDVGKTLAQGVGESAMNAVHGVEHGVEAAGKGIKDAAVWAEHNPGKAALVVGGAVLVGAAVVAAEVATGGMATAGIVAASGWLTTGAAATVFEGLGAAAAVGATAKAGVDVYRHGEIGTLMNQQHEDPAKVEAARKALKGDTGNALLGDAMMGGMGLGKWAVKGVAALRAGSAAEATVAGTGEVATTARAGEAAGAARTAGQGTEAGEAGAAKAAGQAPEAAPLVAGDNPLLTRTENAAEHIAEEVIDTGAATASAFAVLMDKCRQIATVGGAAYQHASDANNIVGTVKSGVGIAKGVYAVAAPDQHEVAPKPANNGTGAGVPDEPTRH